MRRRMRDLVTLAMRRAGALAALIAGAVAATAGTASAADDGLLAEPAVADFGLLGPVGVVAVGLGLIGMLLGAVRRHRKAHAPQQARPQRHASTGLIPAARAQQASPRPSLVEQTAPLPRTRAA